MPSDDGGLSLTVMLISVLSCGSAARRRAGPSPEVVWPQKDKKKRENCLYFCAFPGLFSKFYSSTWELNHHRGWFIEPIGSHGTA